MKSKALLMYGTGLVLVILLVSLILMQANKMEDKAAEAFVRRLLNE